MTENRLTCCSYGAEEDPSGPKTETQMDRENTGRERKQIRQDKLSHTYTCYEITLEISASASTNTLYKQNICLKERF